MNALMQGKMFGNRTTVVDACMDDLGRLHVLNANPYPLTANYYLSTPVLAVAAGATEYFSVQTGDEDIVLISMNLQSASGETLVELYESTAVTGGTVKAPVNTDLQSTLTFPATYTESTNLPTGNTLVLAGNLLGQSQAGNFADGSRLVNIRLKKNTLYTMWITNNATGNRDFSIEWVLGAVQDA